MDSIELHDIRNFATIQTEANSSDPTERSTGAADVELVADTSDDGIARLAPPHQQ